MSGTIRRSENIIKISGNPSPIEVKFFSQQLHICISKRKYVDVILDFSNVEALFPSFMLPLICLCRKESLSNKIEFDIKFPDAPNLKSLFHNANWSHLINEQRYEETTYDEGVHFPAFKFLNGTQQYEAVDKVISIILNQLGGIGRDALKTLEWSINEITDNVLSHSESDLGGLMQASVYSEKNNVEFVVSDAGIGIPKSLGIRDHNVALEKAIQEGFTRNSKTNQGNGLFGTFRIAHESKGSFSIASGNSVLLATLGGDINFTKVEKQAFFPGTSVSATISCSDQNLISKALFFKGRKHTPSTDYVENRYLSDQGHFNFKLVDEVPSFGNRESGKIAQNKLLHLLSDETEAKIIIDFEGIGIISSSFADEAFAKLLENISLLDFMKRIELKNLDVVVEGIINRALTQRKAL